MNKQGSTTHGVRGGRPIGKKAVIVTLDNENDDIETQARLLRAIVSNMINAASDSWHVETLRFVTSDIADYLYGSAKNVNEQKTALIEGNDKHVNIIELFGILLKSDESAKAAKLYAAVYEKISPLLNTDTPAEAISPGAQTTVRQSDGEKFHALDSQISTLKDELKKTKELLGDCSKRYDDVKRALDTCRFVSSYFYSDGDGDSLLKTDALSHLSERHNVAFTKTPYEVIVQQFTTKTYRKKMLEDKIAKLKKVLSENEIKAITTGVVLVKAKAIEKIDETKAAIQLATTQHTKTMSDISDLETALSAETNNRTRCRKLINAE